MSRRFFVALLGLGLALFLMPQVSLAAEDHIAEAIAHTKQAILHGQKVHADLLGEHAKTALSHARLAEIANANPHTEEAVKELEQTIDDNNNNHTALATGHAEAALTHLEQVK
jgi:hypothetical protein